MAERNTKDAAADDAFMHENEMLKNAVALAYSTRESVC